MKLDSVPTVHIGVDVSKAKLDIFVPATKEGVRRNPSVCANETI